MCVIQTSGWSGRSAAGQPPSPVGWVAGCCTGSARLLSTCVCLALPCALTSIGWPAARLSLFFLQPLPAGRGHRPEGGCKAEEGDPGGGGDQCQVGDKHGLTVGRQRGRSQLAAVTKGHMRAGAGSARRWLRVDDSSLHIALCLEPPCSLGCQGVVTSWPTSLCQHLTSSHTLTVQLCGPLGSAGCSTTAKMALPSGTC